MPDARPASLVERDSCHGRSYHKQKYRFQNPESWSESNFREWIQQRGCRARPRNLCSTVTWCCATSHCHQSRAPVVAESVVCDNFAMQRVGHRFTKFSARRASANSGGQRGPCAGGRAITSRVRPAAVEGNRLLGVPKETRVDVQACVAAAHNLAVSSQA